MGLSGSGKSTFAEPLAKSLFATWINADQVRENYDDWDFSVEGRIRQSQRMKYLCDGVVMAGGVAVADFICPTEETRKEGVPYSAWHHAFDIYSALLRDQFLLWAADCPHYYTQLAGERFTVYTSYKHIYSILIGTR